MARLVKSRSPRQELRTSSVLGRSLPFSRALLVAAALHTAVIVLRLRTDTKPRGEAPRDYPRRELRVELDFGTEALNPSSNNTLGTQELAPPSITRNQPVRATVSVTRAPTSEATRITPPTTEIVASDSSAVVPRISPRSEGPTGPGPEHKINLGLNGDLLRILDAQYGPDASRVPERRPKIVDRGAELTRKLNAAMLADDVRHGLARGNALLGALDSAVRHSGPTRGQAVIRVTVNAQGEVTSLELASGGLDDWAAVLNSFRQQVKSKRVRVPGGAAGLRITFSVSAKVQRSSGKEIESTPVGVSGPAAASGGLAMLGTFDLADLSNKTARILAVRVVSEEQL